MIDSKYVLSFVIKVLRMKLWYEQEWHVRKFLYKNLFNSARLWRRVGLALGKKEKYFALPDYQLTEHLVSVFAFYEKRTRL